MKFHSLLHSAATLYVYLIVAPKATTARPLKPQSIVSTGNIGTRSELQHHRHRQPTTEPLERTSSISKSDRDNAVAQAAKLRAGGGLTLPTISKTMQTSLWGALAFAAIEQASKVVLKELDIKFPSMLAGCLALFATLLMLDKVQPAMASKIATFLTPGASLLAMFFPMFFVPGLALLPLAHSVGGPVEIVKLLVTVALGLTYSIVTIAMTVMMFRGGKLQFGAGGGLKAVQQKAKKQAKKVAAAPKPFSEQQFKMFAKLAVVAGVAALLTSGKHGKPIAVVSENCFLTLFTVASYMWAARLPTDFVKVVHPLVTCCVMILAVVKVMSLLHKHRSFHDILRAYKVGSLDYKKAGSADILMFLLGPSAVSFAIGMYDKRKLLFSNLTTVMASTLVSSVGGLFGTAAFVRLINLGGKGLGGNTVRLSCLARNVTTALALALTSMINGDLSLCAAVVCMTGVMGATYGKPILAYFGIKDPVTRGLCIGGSSQGLGVASMADESEAFPFSALAMVLTAVCSTTLVTFPSFKNALVKVATGSKI
mmetsp:Transcript_23562/g.65554  ORF Transcript_23562/g.65554 Transcript_23562/m.65554 type:complete len:539 (-) Transcript_23562:108-1724(-)